MTVQERLYLLLEFVHTELQVREASLLPTDDPDELGALDEAREALRDVKALCASTPLFTGVEAMTIMRVFIRLEQQTERMQVRARDRHLSDDERASAENDWRSLARLMGSLSYKIFGSSHFSNECPLNPESWAVDPVQPGLPAREDSKCTQAG